MFSKLFTTVIFYVTVYEEFLQHFRGSN